MGMTLFYTDFDRTAMHVRLIEKLGRAAVDSNEVAIENLDVPEEHVVGAVGEGFYHLLESLNPERIVIGIEAVGIRPAAGRGLCRGRRRRGDEPQGRRRLRAWPAMRQRG